VEAPVEAGGIAIIVGGQNVQNSDGFDATAAEVDMPREGATGVFKLSAVSEAGAVSVGVASGEVEKRREVADFGFRHVAVVGDFERFEQVERP